MFKQDEARNREGEEHDDKLVTAEVVVAGVAEAGDDDEQEERCHLQFRGNSPDPCGLSFKQTSTTPSGQNWRQHHDQSIGSTCKEVV